MQLDWSKIKTVMLDMDGTLLDLHYDNYFWREHLPKAYSEKHQLEVEHARQILEPIFRELQGELEWYCVDYWSERLDMDIPKLKGEVSSKVRYRPGAEQFLQHCQNNVDDVRLVTNAHRKVLALKDEKLNISQYFHHTVCSHELGAPKEQQDFWHKLHRSQKFDPQTTLFIDDNEAVLKSAQLYGIKWLKGVEQPDLQSENKQYQGFDAISSFDDLGHNFQD